MSIIVTPSQLKAQGEFYIQLAQMTAAGVTIAQGVEMLKRSAPSPNFRRIAEATSRGLQLGQPFAEALRGASRTIPEFDVALIEAGEHSGRLDQCLRILGDYYKERGTMASRMLSQLMYPIFLFHFAIFLFPMPLFTGLILNGATGAFLKNKLAILIPFYAALLFFFWIVKSDRNAAIRNMVEQVALRIPFISGLRRCLSLARLCAALEALINAGVTIIEAWDLAARASGSQQLMRAVAQVRPQIVSGELPSDAIAAQGVYPDLFVSSYRTGEMSGQLDDALRRMYRYYQEAATDGLNRLTEWLPKIVYFIVAIAVGYQVISFYAGYFNQVNNIIGP